MFKVKELHSTLHLSRKLHDHNSACVRCQVYECHTIDGLCRECNYDDLFPRANGRNEPSFLEYLWYGVKRRLGLSSRKSR